MVCKNLQTAILKKNNKDLIKILKQTDAKSINEEDVHAFLMAAINTKNLKAINILLKHNFNPNVYYYKNNNITESEHIYIVGWLIKKYTIHKTNDEKAEYEFYYKAIQLFLAAGADPNIFLKAKCDKRRQKTPLQLIIRSSGLNVLYLILEPKICKVKLNTNMVDFVGNTMLHLAVEHREVGIVKILLKTDISLEQKNNEGLTALEVAIKQQKLHEYLIESKLYEKRLLELYAIKPDPDKLQEIHDKLDIFILSKKKLDNIAVLIEAELHERKKSKKHQVMYKKGKRRINTSKTNKSVIVLSSIFLTCGITFFIVALKTQQQKLYLIITIIVTCASLLVLGLCIFELAACETNRSDDVNKVDKNEKEDCTKIANVEGLVKNYIKVANMKEISAAEEGNSNVVSI